MPSHRFKECLFHLAIRNQWMSSKSDLTGRVDKNRIRNIVQFCSNLLNLLKLISHTKYKRILNWNKAFNLYRKMRIGDEYVEIA